MINQDRINELIKIGKANNVVPVEVSQVEKKVAEQVQNQVANDSAHSVGGVPGTPAEDTVVKKQTSRESIIAIANALGIRKDD